MAPREPIKGQIERSSFGTKAAKRLRRRTSVAVARRVLDRVERPQRDGRRSQVRGSEDPAT
jgi:hypothetical protein